MSQAETSSQTGADADKHLLEQSLRIVIRELVKRYGDTPAAFGRWSQENYATMVLRRMLTELP